jgi:integrase
MEMSRIRLTAETLPRLAAPEGRRAEYFDEGLRGFSVRVSPAGRKSFCVLYRSGRRLRRYTLGTYPVLSLSRARTLARAALAEAAMGGDPALAKRARREASSFAELADEYLERYARPNKKSWGEDERRIRTNLLPAFRHRPASDISRADVRELLDEIVLRGAPFEANATHALVRKMFNWAISRDLVEKNPCFGLPRPAKARQRHHVLSEADLCTFWAALSKESVPIRTSLKLRLLTAQRGREVLTLRWEDVELETGWWTIPAERTKNGLPHRVPLAASAMRLLGELERSSSWVFPNRAGDGPVPSTQKAIERIRRRAGIELRGHDLRRTAASYMTSMGIPRLVVAKILNHIETGVTAVYDRYSYDREKREALETWATRLVTLVEDV